MELEQAFGAVEDSANGVTKSARAVASQATALAKAAKSGNIVALKRSQERLGEALTALEEGVQASTSCWPYSEDEELAALERGFQQELEAAAAGLGLNIYEQDKRLVSWPSVLRILPAERAVRIDRKKVTTIRPSFLASLLLKNQNKSSSFSSQRFLESLYTVYTEIRRGTSSITISPGSSDVVRLLKVYKLMTALPGAARDYDRSDFARDLYALESQGPRQTRNGATVDLVGARNPEFSFIGPDGNRVDYYGIRFIERDK